MSPNHTVGVCVWPEPAPNAPRTVAYPHYVHEILAHAGLCYAPIEPEELMERLPSLKLLVTVGEAEPGPEVEEALRKWVKGGGAWLSVAGVCGMPELFGVELERPSMAVWGTATSTLGAGYLRPDHPLHPILGHLWMPLHYFNGLPVRAAGGQALAGVLDAHQRPTHRAAIVETHAGEGHCLLIAPDITGTVVRVQQGTAVTRDGVPSPDGTAAASDGVLKSDDGAVLDWLFDRKAVRGIAGFSAFIHPIADQWREVLLRSIFMLARERRIALPLLWLYPRNLPALGELSHDSDGNEGQMAASMLDVLEEAGIQSTWCILSPGYEASMLKRIADAGHELAMHYDAMEDNRPWSEDEFDRQWKSLVALFATEPVTNKNHYLRWEGDTEFFEWLVRRRIRFDQSKGASKTGEAGFNFGTCHPYYPVSPRGEVLDVLEVPTPTQDLQVFAPRELLAPLLEAVERHHGVLHLLFHPAHVEKPGVADALKGAIAAARGRGFEWWTARRINDWERARRSVRWTASNTSGSATVVMSEMMPDTTILWLTPDHNILTIDGAAVPTQTVDRWGFRFQSAVFDAGPGAHVLSLG